MTIRKSRRITKRRNKRRYRSKKKMIGGEVKNKIAIIRYILGEDNKISDVEVSAAIDTDSPSTKDFDGTDFKKVLENPVIKDILQIAAPEGEEAVKSKGLTVEEIEEEKKNETELFNTTHVSVKITKSAIIKKGTDIKKEIKEYIDLKNDIEKLFDNLEIPFPKIGYKHTEGGGRWYLEKPELIRKSDYTVSKKSDEEFEPEILNPYFKVRYNTHANRTKDDIYSTIPSHVGRKEVGKRWWGSRKYVEYYFPDSIIFRLRKSIKERISKENKTLQNWEFVHSSWIFHYYSVLLKRMRIWLSAKSMGWTGKKKRIQKYLQKLFTKDGDGNIPIKNFYEISLKSFRGGNTERWNSMINELQILEKVRDKH